MPEPMSMPRSGVAVLAPARHARGPSRGGGAVGTVAPCGEPIPGRDVVAAGSELSMAPEAGQDFVDFFTRMLPISVGVARRILGDQAAAEDAASEALARAYLRWESLRASEYREAWVVRVTTNEALGMVRTRNRRERILRRQLRPDDAAPADEGVLDSALVEQVRALPRRQREVVALRYFAQMSTVEVAAAIDISPGSVKTHLHRAVAALREQGHAALGEAIDV